MPCLVLTLGDSNGTKGCQIWYALIWGVLVPINLLSYTFMTCYSHMQHYWGTMEKMVKLLVICGGIPPRV